VKDRHLTAITPLHLGSAAWAIHRDVLPRVLEAQRLALASGMQVAAAPTAAVSTVPQRAGGSVAVLPLCGVLSPRGSWLSLMLGGGAGGLRGFRASFREALASPDVGAIVIDVDSPGGVISLIPETAEEIRAARGTKPIIAVANTMACSAAYWLAAQADELVCTPSGIVGSIGVYMVHEDYSKWNADFGVDPTYISAGRYKTEGNMDEPLSEGAREDWQAEVDLRYSAFIEDVAAGRGVSAVDVDENFGQGRVFQADPALAAGLIDRIGTIESVVGELLDPSGTAAAAASAGRNALIATVPAPPRAGLLPDDDDEEEEDEQPLCSDCGCSIEASQTQCPDCIAAANADDDEDEDQAALAAEARRRHADLIFD
jgi:capsid assembly protease